MKGFVSLLILCLITAGSFAQSAKTKKYRVSGYVYDQESKESLIGANVYNLNNTVGTTTNNFGFFSLLIPQDESLIYISYVGYERQIINLTGSKDTSITVYLKQSNLLDEVVITDKSEDKKFIQEAIPGKIVINPQTISALPSLTGESDLLKSLQLLPGVKSGTEGTTGLYVRGGNIDQNLYLIDGVPIYNPNHLLGFISTFNTDAIKNIEFYKGSFPARYGQRASSVVDVRMKDGNLDKIRGDVSIGIISAKLNLEGPIIKDKTSFNISARRTYMDMLLKPFIAYENRRMDGGDVDFGYFFTDVNFKINHIINPKNRIMASVYWGEDNYNFSYENNDEYKDNSNNTYKNENKTDMDVRWGNLIGNIGWAHQINDQVFTNLTLSYNRYRSNITTEMISKTISPFSTIENQFEVNFYSGIEDYSLRNDFNHYLNGWNKLNYGYSYTRHHFSPEVSNVSGKENNNSEDFYRNRNTVDGNEVIVFIEDEMDFTEKFSMNPGLHLNIFNVGEKTYTSLQPRFGFRYSILKNLSIKGGYSLMNQNIHLLANGIISMPTDLWVPVTQKVKPIYSHQFSAGAFYNLEKIANFSIEGYYKKLNNVIDYKDGVSSFNTSEDWEEKIAQGYGEAYGVELLAQRTKGNTTGWISYTLSWAFREFPSGEINGGKKYYDRYDSRNQVNITLLHKFNDNYDIAISWVFNTGSRLSIPTASYYEPIDNDYYPQVINMYGEKNNFRMPNYHRMDISFNKHKKLKYGISTWSFNIYNLYNRKNPMFINPGSSPTTLTAYSIMPLIPTISYTFKFN